MSNKQKHIDDFFKEKLGSYSEVPPADAWGDLDARLDTLVPTATPTSPFRWIGHVAMVSIIAVLSVSLYHKYAGNTENTDGISKEQTINKLESSNATIAVNNSATPMAATNVPSVGAGIDAGNAGDGGNSTNNDNSTASGTTASVTSTGGNNNNSTAKATQSNNNKTQTNTDKSKGGKKANYAPYNNSLDHMNSKTKNPANIAYNSTVGKIGIEQKIEEVQYNSSDNQSIGTYDINASQPSNTLATPQKAEVKPTVPKAKTELKNVVAPKPKQPIRDFARFDAGIKGGYERGSNIFSAAKYVIAPYIQYNLSKKVAIMVQPAVKFANSTVRTIGTQSYYSVNADGKVVDNGSYRTVTFTGTSMDTTYYTKYRYSQSHDSIVKSNKIGGRYMEYELPVMFKYNLSKKMSVYGGPNVVFSQLQGVREETYTKTGIIRTIDTVMVGKTMVAASPVNDVIKYGESPISNYNGPLYPATQDNRIRFGAIVGVSYEYSDRWLLDALIQQAPAKRDVKGGFNVNAPLSATYFRVSIGYKLTK